MSGIRDVLLPVLLVTRELTPAILKFKINARTSSILQLRSSEKFMGNKSP